MKFSDIGTGDCLHSIIRLEHNIIVQAYMFVLTDSQQILYQ